MAETRESSSNADQPTRTNSSSSHDCCGDEFFNKVEVKQKLLIRRMIDDNRKKLHALAREQKKLLEDNLISRRKRLKHIMSEPGVVMAIDKVSFVCGVLIIMIIEAVLLLAPENMHLLYTALLVPLMVARYIMYRADQQHYFMYDFCYFAQLLMVTHIYVYPNNIQLEKAIFSISNGPLLLAIVMWRNSIVFHSFDKMTSMFIHLLPSLVTFCHRWAGHLANNTYPIHENVDESITTILNNFWSVPFGYYIIWQMIYLIKTELLSKRKLAYNTEMMTSLRWLTKKKDSKSYKLFSVFGEHNQLPTFVGVQALYTAVTYLVIPFLWHSIWFHALYVVFIFVFALANGATYYFNVFAKRYIEEIEKRDSEIKDDSIK